ncbi:MAG: threonylcarbamoyl-AMP synthase [Bacteroidetes bacterium]|nr:MAG: threonylcarbamoyl-AMP synthase [Bacteroidota bacterium]
MRTQLTTSPRTAAERLLQNDVVAFPTETVYGLGANAFSGEAVKRIFRAKGRPADNPLIVHVAETDRLPSVVRSVPKYAERLIEAFMPGPLTVVLPKQRRISALATAGLDTVGVRIPDHAVARRFLAECGVPVAAPSANLSGKPSPTTWQAVKRDLNGRIPMILKGNPSRIGVESTVVDCTGAAPVILRAGGLTLEELRSVVPSARLMKPNSAGRVKSPGMKYRHYSPLAYVFLVSGPSETVPMKSAAYIGLHGVGVRPFGMKKVCRSVTEYARSLYRFFRECDDRGIETVYCETVSEDGLGLALMDRIRKASLQ